MLNFPQPYPKTSNNELHEMRVLKFHFLSQSLWFVNQYQSFPFIDTLVEHCLTMHFHYFITVFDPKCIVQGILILSLEMLLGPL
jgi:hypothetical protein